MEAKALSVLIQAIIVAAGKRVPEFLVNPEDQDNNQGNCAICIVDAAGNVHGRMFGSDKIRQRHSFRIAWIKASQVWITGLKTGEFETQVYAGKIDEHDFGISRPDFIGWEGGQPIVVGGQTRLSVGFSGLRGTSDLAIVQKAAADVTAR